MKRTIGVLLVIAALSYPLMAGDWTQFRGPTRDGISTETGLLKQWPAEGPKMLWSYQALGTGYASLAVVGGKIYTTGLEAKTGFLYCFDNSGKLLWKVPYGPEWTGSNPGTRTTPTFDAGKLYLMSGNGLLTCRNASDGKEVWSVDTFKKFGGKNITWGISESVLIDGDKVICTPGGPDASVVALKKATGQTLWTTKGLSDKSAYCCPQIIAHGGKRILLTMLEKTVVGIDPEAGKVLWKYPHKVSYDINAVAPAYANGMIYLTNGYNHGGLMLQLSPDGSSVTKKWTEPELDVHHGGVVLLGKDIHGAGTDGQWICLDLTSGKIKYRDRLVGKGSVIFADGLIYGYGENGTVGLIRPSPTGYKLISSFEISLGNEEHWAHPVVSNGILYIRHGKALMAYDIKAK
ncbi:MAG: PQQ-binding-like beta-propeller repeat protein [Phycisphaerae bacterium]|nr:PQQ-binding-like beta-propeller repeat protein [Phycisphaerae bacterium]